MAFPDWGECKYTPGEEYIDKQWFYIPHFNHYANFKVLPEHLNSWSCTSTTFCPFSWLGEWHLVYDDKRGALFKYFDNHDKWQSQPNGLSDKRNDFNLGIPLKISRGSVVKLLLFKVLYV